MSVASELGFIAKLPKALPGLALLIGTMVVIRLWIEPWMAGEIGRASCRERVLRLV